MCACCVVEHIYFSFRCVEDCDSADVVGVVDTVVAAVVVVAVVVDSINNDKKSPLAATQPAKAFSSLQQL